MENKIPTQLHVAKSLSFGDRIVTVMIVCFFYLFYFIDEGVYEMFDLWSFSREQDQLLIGQIELQHVFGGDGHKQDVCITEQMHGN